jgi:hypothetical protein
MHGTPINLRASLLRSWINCAPCRSTGFRHPIWEVVRFLYPAVLSFEFTLLNYGRPSPKGDGLFGSE